MELKPGDRVDRYVLIEPLGEGGQASVWKARDPLEPERPCALKLVHLDVSRPADAERVRREARALAQLEHPSLVRCHALFEDLKLGKLGMALDFVDGMSLGIASDDARMTERHRTAALRHVAHALAYVHDKGHVHRDLKLDNVLVTQGFWGAPQEPSNVKLVDFGIAQIHSAPALTAVDSIVGTIAYIAPELLDPTHFGGRGTSPAADVFAFGVLAWKLLIGGHPTGLPPGSGVVDYGTAYRRAAESGVRFPPGAPAGAWGDLLRDALSLKPEARLKDGGELAQRTEQAGDFATVIHSGAFPDGVSPVGPTSVGSPAAMFAKTERLGTPLAARIAEDPTLLANVYAEPQRANVYGQPQPIVARQPIDAVTTAATPSSKRNVGSIVLTIAVVVMAGLAIAIVWLLVNPASSEPPPLQGLSPSAQPSPIPPVLPSASASLEIAAETPDAGPQTAVASLPNKCTEICACCPSNNNCGGPCDDPLGTADLADLRLGGVLGPGLESLEVCVISRVPGGPMTCTPATATVAGTIPDANFVLSGTDVRAGVEVFVRDHKTEARIAQAVLPQKITRLAFCKGVDLQLAGDAGFFGRVQLYFDPHGTKPAKRCSP